MNRFALARREAVFCLLLTLLYFFAWYGAAYFIPSQLELWGLPLWFLLSCMVMPLLFIVLCVLMVNRLFIEIPLDTHPLASEESPHES
ncbi:YhdT family protein [Aeromonas fluvialis]|uniref:YhdT family protein n=1 Tax=Aeromonas fluvialis TaxID=591962 RepID=UPI0005A7F3B4|nr:YhdT family protein [Aeromonas fluvialis]